MLYVHPFTRLQCITFTNSCLIVVQCEGSWGDYETLLSERDRGGITAKIERNFALFSKGSYTIRISPGVDVLFYLAVAVCIDKMHYEANRK